MNANGSTDAESGDRELHVRRRDRSLATSSRTRSAPAASAAARTRCTRRTARASTRPNGTYDITHRLDRAGRRRPHRQRRRLRTSRAAPRSRSRRPRTPTAAPAWRARCSRSQQATLANDVCGSYGSASRHQSAARAYGVSNGNCYRFTLTATDHVGNATSLTTHRQGRHDGTRRTGDLVHGPLERQHVRERHDALLPPVGRRHLHGERDRRERSGDRDRDRERGLLVHGARRLPRARCRRATRSTSPSTARATAAARSRSVRSTTRASPPPRRRRSP